MKQIAGAIAGFNQADISTIEKTGVYDLKIGEEQLTISMEDVEIQTEDIPGWLVASEGSLTIALDIHLTEELKQEGIAREFINKIQNIRKESDFEVTDRIVLRIQKHDFYNAAVLLFKEYISNQTLASELVLVDQLDSENSHLVEIETDVDARIKVDRC
jgi:isoleucyl-tRNA synthetase